jgi:hypothetical protein
MQNLDGMKENYRSFSFKIIKYGWGSRAFPAVGIRGVPILLPAV